VPLLPVYGSDDELALLYDLLLHCEHLTFVVYDEEIGDDNSKTCKSDIKILVFPRGRLQTLVVQDDKEFILLLFHNQVDSEGSLADGNREPRQKEIVEKRRFGRRFASYNRNHVNFLLRIGLEVF